MAQYPCSRCTQRYRGAQSTAYPALVTPGATYSERLRLCPGCLQSVVSSVAWLPADPDDASTPDRCMMCRGDDNSTAAFLTYYPAGSDRRDLYGRVCGPCTKSLLSYVWGAQEDHQTFLRL